MFILNEQYIHPTNQLRVGGWVFTMIICDHCIVTAVSCLCPNICEHKYSQSLYHCDKADLKMRFNIELMHRVWMRFAIRWMRRFVIWFIVCEKILWLIIMIGDKIHCVHKNIVIDDKIDLLYVQKYCDWLWWLMINFIVWWMIQIIVWWMIQIIVRWMMTIFHKIYLCRRTVNEYYGFIVRWMIKIYWRSMIKIIHKICWRWVIKIIHKIYWRWMIQIIEDEWKRLSTRFIEDEWWRLLKIND
jgi:hypothetical protein